MKKLLTLVVGVALLVGLSGAGVAQPSASMYTLEGIYDYLMEGVVPTKGGHNLEPPAGATPGDTQFKSLEQILDGIKTQFESAGASAENVEEGVTFWSTNSGSWGLQTGEMAAGGGGLISTGQTESYVNYDDGYYKKGAARDYTDNQDGTVTDNVTGLIWAADGSKAGCYNGGERNWTQAITWAEGLTFAGYSDWRLPNSIEIMTLMLNDATQSAPYINQTYFPSTVSGYYWSSTSDPRSTGRALGARFSYGYLNDASKTYTGYVRAVRGGE